MTNNKLASLETAHNKFKKYLDKKGRASATIIAYSKDVEQLIEYLKEKGITQVTSVDPKHIKGFKESLLEKKYTAKSVSRKLNGVKTFFRFLKNEKVISQNPAEPVSHPRYKIKPPRILSEMEYRALRDAAREDTRMSAIIELLLQTGIRIGELARLKTDDVKNGLIIIKPYESHEGRKIPLNDAAKKALDDYLEQRPKKRTKALFLTKNGHPFLVRNIRGAIKRYFKIAGLKDVKVNDLRHTFIAHQLKAGNSVIVVQRLVGHKRLSTTEKYLEFVETQQEKDMQIKEL